MKQVLFLSLAALISPSCWAIEPISPSGRIFGLANGTYEGDGTLESQTAFVPDLSFHSTRELAGGVITARTTATLLGVTVASAEARLQVVAEKNGEFTLLDLDESRVPAGSGKCDSTSCSFRATVMQGELTLEETWTPDEAGFSVDNASQVFKGKAATYSGKFARQ